MMKYADERVVLKPTCSKQELRKQIEALEKKNYGHVLTHKKEKTDVQKRIFSVRENRVVCTK